MPNFTFFGIFRRREDLEKIIVVNPPTPINFPDAGTHTKSFNITRMDFVE